MPKREWVYESMGTRWRISVGDGMGDAAWDAIQKTITRMADEFDQTYSRFIATSLVRRLATHAGEAEVPADFTAMLDWYRRLWHPSNKKLNPLVGFSISDLGYDADYTLTPHRTIRSTPDLDATVTILDERHIRIAEPVLFDFGALGKGYFIDNVAAYLQKAGLRRFVVDGSGDIFHAGSEPLRVGLEDPDDPSKIIGAIAMSEGAMASSSGNRRTWRDWHHIIDPATLRSPREILATWVIADRAVLADALATGLFFAAPERFAAFDFEYCMLNAERRVRRSAGFAAELF
ncbi:FAD:protein FMN transferase [Candidatus Parcubacteria bacterium]|nr:MAG: FAD:protein FMN transferase [Candidatus Parcubacteria bacterium]